MAKMIGGPMHESIIKVEAGTLICPIMNNSRAPKEIRRSGSGILQGIYKRTNIIRDGEVIYRFVSGYYYPVGGVDGIYRY